MSGAPVDPGADSRAHDWRRLEPLAELIDLFLPARLRPLLPCWALLLRELEEAALDLSEAQVAQLKLAWWREELQLGTTGKARHPLVRSLFADARAQRIDAPDWLALVDGAIALLDDESSVADVPAQLLRYRRLGLPAARIEALLLGGEVESTARMHAVHLALDQWLLVRRRQRQAWPLDLVARHGLSPAAAESPAAGGEEYARAHARVLRQVSVRTPRCGTYRALAGVAREGLLAQLARHGRPEKLRFRPGPLSAFAVWRIVRRATERPPRA